MNESELVQLAASGAARSRVDGVFVPLDDERNHRAVVADDPEGFPFEGCAIRFGARSRVGTPNFELSFMDPLRSCIDILGPCGPTHELRLSETSQEGRRLPFEFRLAGVDREDFEIALFPKLQEGVPGSSARMNPSHDRAHSRHLLDQSDSLVEIGRGPDQVVHLGNRVERKRPFRGRAEDDRGRACCSEYLAAVP